MTDPMLDHLVALGMLLCRLAGQPVVRFDIRTEDSTTISVEAAADPSKGRTLVTASLAGAVIHRAAVRLVFTEDVEVEPVPVLLERALSGSVAVSWPAESSGVALSSLRRLFDGCLRAIADAADPAAPSPQNALLDEQWQREVCELGSSPYPAADCGGNVLAGFSAAVAAGPERVAVCRDSDRLSYRELDRLASLLAAELSGRGVGPGDRVGICTGRSIQTIVTMLAVLRCGAAYVPLDPSHPAERSAFVLEDAGVRLVVVHPDHRAVAPAGLPVLVTAGAPDLPSADSAAPPDGVPSLPVIDPESPAYVIYTSGSTGRPKGVVVRHRNLTALTTAGPALFGLDSDDVWTWFHSEAFDFSVWEIWGCLTTGGRIVVVPSETCRSPADFARLLRVERVSVLSQTPSALGQLAELDADELRAPAVRLVILGGEPLDSTMLGGWFRACPDARVVNMYGITETTVHVTAQDVTVADLAERLWSVGHPIAGWTVQVRDVGRRLLPPGFTGEIVVGGAGVAAGYLGRPELTAQRFAEEDGLPVYYSGDRGRMLADGRIEHLGRLDSQVKLRGYRIELGEIRARLLEDAAVRAAEVILVPGNPATTRLHGFVALRELPAGRPDATADRLGRLRTRLAEVLPAHMVPSALTVLDTLPLTGNGKLDVSRLEQISDEQLASPPGAAPSAGEPAPGGIGSAVTAAHREVLGHSMDPDADFFAAGGNSLAAASIVRILRAQGYRLAPKDLYAHPSINGLTSHLESTDRVPT